MELLVLLVILLIVIIELIELNIVKEALFNFYNTFLLHEDSSNSFVCKTSNKGL